MSIIGSKVRQAVRAWLLESRSSLENPQTPLSYPAEWLLDIFNGGRTDSGIRVSEMTALQVSTVFACVQLIGSTIGAVPLHIFELMVKDKRPGKRVALEHGTYDLLRWEPNPEMTAFTFRQTLQTHALLWGNAYAEIERNGANQPVALWPRNPARTTAYRLPNGRLVYKTTEGMDEQSEVIGHMPYDQAGRVIADDDMVHIPGLTLDGRVGQSTIQLARQAVGLALATEKYGAKYFGNGARPGGVLEHPGKLSPQARETLRRSWQEAQGGENAHKVAVLEEGLKWQEAGNKPEEAQFLETRQFQKSDICSVFSVPPHMIGSSQQQNRANTEQIALEFLAYCIGPWLEKWEQELKRKLFPTLGRSAGRFFPKFETRRLTMPDAESRRNFYASGKQWGYLSTNDIHEFEDMNPVDDPAADAYWMPVNMQEMGSPPKAKTDPVPADVTPGEAPAPDQGKPTGADERLMHIYRPLLQDALSRWRARTNGNRSPEVFQRLFEPIFTAIGEDVEVMP